VEEAASEGGTMTFDEALAALVGMNGQRVDVVITDLASTATIATMSGVLRGAIPMSEEEASSEEPLYLSLGTTDAPAEVWLDRLAFDGAERGGDSDIALRIGDVEVRITEQTW
jgi:hypothetical protein